jgi:long-chain acyl-CoA synthetase
VLWNCIGAARNLAAYGLEGNRFLSFLPLSHTYEHTAGFISPMALGGEIFVSRGPEHFARELRLAAPTVLIVVPRFCEVMQLVVSTASQTLQFLQQFQLLGLMAHRTLRQLL